MDKITNENAVLIDYNEEDDAQVNVVPLQDDKSNANKYILIERLIDRRGHYAGVGGTGFQSFFLKDEIMKAISECGFEHPSEGFSSEFCLICSSESMYP